MLTPTLKLRRTKIGEVCADCINALYQELGGKRAH